MEQRIVIEASGTKYYLDDQNQRHREDGPAVEWPDGSKYWYIHGKEHREDGPAIEYYDGAKEWYINGERHRLDGPAIIWSKIFGGVADSVNSVKDTIVGSKDAASAAKNVGGKAWEGIKGIGQAAHGAMLMASDAITPKMPASANAGRGNVVHISQNITHHGDAKDTKAVKDSHKAGIQHAYKQIGALKGGQ